MIHRRQALLGGTVAALMAPSVARAQARPQRVLYLSQSAGWLHEPVARPEDGSLALSELAMRDMAAASGAFNVRVTQDASEITPALLTELDVLVFYTTGALPISRQSWQAIQAWVASGRGGFVGLHSAADTGLDFPGGRDSYVAMLGGDFAGHPWNQGDPVRIQALDGGHPVTAMWPAAFDYREETYQYQAFDPAACGCCKASTSPIRRPGVRGPCRCPGCGRSGMGGCSTRTWATPPPPGAIRDSANRSSRRSCGPAGKAGRTPNPTRWTRP